MNSQLVRNAKFILLLLHVEKNTFRVSRQSSVRFVCSHNCHVVQPYRYMGRLTNWEFLVNNHSPLASFFTFLLTNYKFWHLQLNFSTCVYRDTQRRRLTFNVVCNYYSVRPFQCLLHVYVYIKNYLKCASNTLFHKCGIF